MNFVIRSVTTKFKLNKKKYKSLDYIPVTVANILNIVSKCIAQSLSQIKAFNIRLLDDEK